MATHNAFQEIGSLLRGGPTSEQQEQQVIQQQSARADGSSGGSPRGARSPKRKGQYPSYGREAAALSQLSDLAKEIGSLSKGPVATVAAQFQAPSQPNFSQESLIVAPLQFQPPSQPDIPPPVLPDSQATGPAAETAANTQEEVQARPPVAPAAAALLPFTAADFMAHPPMMLATAEFMAHPGAFAMQLQEEMQQHNMPREKNSKPTRRGPMDEMRQLVRILVKIIPHSIAYIGSGEEAGGGNRISEEQIKIYLEKTLGEAPRPTWGVPGGWQQYVSQMFTWALGRTVSEDDAKRCAKREPGRSWEALESEMAALGVHPNSWPLPLTLEGVQAAEKNPVPQPVPQIVIKRTTDEAGQPVSKRQKGGGGGGVPDLDKLGEVDLWNHVVQVLAECQAKQGKAADQGAVMAAKMDAKQRLDALLGGAGMNMFQYVPVAMGLDGGQSVMALLGGMQGGMGGMMLPQAAQFGLQAQQPGAPQELPAGQDMMEQTNAAAIQAAAANMAAVIAAQAMGTEERPRKRGREDGGDPAAQSGQEAMEDPAGKAAAEAALAAAAVAVAAERAKHAPLSSQEARGTLFGALGGGMAAAGAGEEAQAQQGHQAQQAGGQFVMPGNTLGGPIPLQAPLLYAQSGGLPSAAFMMPNALAGMMVQGAFGGAGQQEGASAAEPKQEEDPSKQQWKPSLQAMMK